VQATVYNLAGAPVDTVELNDAIFGIVPNIPVVHQAVLRQQANARLGTHDTKTRAEVSGGGAKPWRQKGTGRARQGSTRSPQWRHGGVVFGPHPRSYNQDLPRKMRRLAMRSVLSDKAASGSLLIIDSFADLEPRTKAMLAVLATLKLAGRRVLIMTPTHEENVMRAAGNLPDVKTMLTPYLSLLAMLKADVLLMPRSSVDVIESILGTTGGRRSRPVTLPEGMAAPATAASPLDLQVEQTPGASTATAAHVTTEHASRGVEEAITESAAAHNATAAAATGTDEATAPETVTTGEATVDEATGDDETTPDTTSASAL
jgi:large subunit ribosomal protein L4